MNNAVFVIRPYKWNGMWVFDDERVGLDKEPFVAGADTMIDTAVQLKGISNAESGFLLVFSASPFPEADFEMQWVRAESGGNVYLGRFDIEGQVFRGRPRPAIPHHEQVPIGVSQPGLLVASPGTNFTAKAPKRACYPLTCQFPLTILEFCEKNHFSYP